MLTVEEFAASKKLLRIYKGRLKKKFAKGRFYL
jgi:hypothetical protein